MPHRGAAEFKSRGSVLLAVPRWPPVFPGLAADLAAAFATAPAPELVTGTIVAHASAVAAYGGAPILGG